MIEIPESVIFYLSAPANRVAVNLMAQSGTIPGELALDELEQFEVARLAAQRVQLDLWRMLRAVWAGTWGVAVRAALPAATLRPFGEHEEYDIPPTIEEAWDEHQTYGGYTLASGHGLITGVRRADRDRRLHLIWYVLSPDGEVDRTIEFGPPWTWDGDWNIAESIWASIVAGSSSVDETALRELAEDAAGKIAAAIG